MSEIEARLRELLDERYHHRHPFNVRMHEGTLTQEELRTWIRNRYYYQTRIPMKDSAILTKTEDPNFRRNWVRRVRDHDGDEKSAGGLELWLRLGDGVGLDREEVASLRNVLPGVRRACDAYVAFVNSHELLESVASSLTELYAGTLMGERIKAFEKHYDWIAPDALAYFRSRTSQAPRDAQEGLDYVNTHAKTEAQQEACVAALTRKCEILWQLLDAIEWAHRRPKLSSRARLREQENLIVLPERAIEINATGREVIDLCDGTRTVNRIAECCREFHPDAPQVEAEVYDFLEGAESAGALEISR
ncbi:MAG: pyrroloquinoline-quinone synthase PqqC [Myxococcales bacterium]|nr:pyrroloquinoline-quinone synthase PqqC [Myxococcales bacterium]